MRLNSPAAAIAMWMAFTSVALEGVGQDRIPQLQREGPKDVDSATLTGCVAKDTAPDTYKLTNVKNATKDWGLNNLVSAPAAVRLSTIDVDLARHVGRRVSVTGLYSTRGRATDAGSPQPAISSTLEKGEHGALPTLNVKSLAMIADSCSESAAVQ